MQKSTFLIDDIPAELWGSRSERLILAVHGQMSHKEDAVIALLAEEAAVKGYQTLSFDLPEHGERLGKGPACKVDICVSELQRVLEAARKICDDVSLFGCSIGVYFSLLAFHQDVLRQALFVSPLVDMQAMIEGMMQAFSITPARLEQMGEIALPIGQTLYWDYYCYVKEHPVMKWPVPTAILRGSLDVLCPVEGINAFSHRFGCTLESIEGAEHFIFLPEHMDKVRLWLGEYLTDC